MARFRLSRRAVLRGAGSIAIALPWLEIMEPERRARAQLGAAAPAQRFLSVYTPGGAVIQPINKWSPTGTENAPVLSPILAPLEPVKSRVLVVDGLQMASAVGEQHQSGIIALLTGTKQNMPPPNGAIPGMNSFAAGLRLRFLSRTIPTENGANATSCCIVSRTKLAGRDSPGHHRLTTRACM